MSIASEISRLQGAKADIKAAIQAKGVSVPSSAKLDDYDAYIAQISGGGARLQSKTATPSTSQQVIQPDNGYDGLDKVTIAAVTAAIDADIQAGNIKNGVNILGVTGNYSCPAPVLQSKSVTPTTGQQQVTPDAGYDGLSEVVVAAVPTETKTATPSGSPQSITPSAGKFLSLVQVQAVSLQTKRAEANGAVLPDSGYTGLRQVTVDVPDTMPLTPTAGDYPVVENAGIGRIAATSLTTTGISITIPVTGTYRLKWVAFRSSTSGTNSSRLYRKRSNTTSAIGTEITSWTNSYYQTNTLDIACNAGDEIIVYARSRGTSYYVCAGALSACVAQKMWTN